MKVRKKVMKRFVSSALIARTSSKVSFKYLLNLNTKYRHKNSAQDFLQTSIKGTKWSLLLRKTNPIYFFSLKVSSQNKQTSSSIT